MNRFMNVIGRVLCVATLVVSTPSAIAGGGKGDKAKNRVVPDEQSGLIMPTRMRSGREVVATERFVRELRTDTRSQQLISIVTQDAQASQAELRKVQAELERIRQIREQLEQDEAERLAEHQRELETLRQRHQKELDRLLQQKSGYSQSEAELLEQMENLVALGNSVEDILVMLRELGVTEETIIKYEERLRSMVAERDRVKTLVDAAGSALSRVQQERQNLENWHTKQMEALQRELAQRQEGLNKERNQKLQGLLTEQEQAEARLGNIQARLDELNQKAEQARRERDHQAQGLLDRDHILKTVRTTNIYETWVYDPDAPGGKRRLDESLVSKFGDALKGYMPGGNRTKKHTRTVRVSPEEGKKLLQSPEGVDSSYAYSEDSGSGEGYKWKSSTTTKTSYKSRRDNLESGGEAITADTTDSDQVDGDELVADMAPLMRKTRRNWCFRSLGSVLGCVFATTAPGTRQTFKIDKEYWLEQQLFVLPDNPNIAISSPERVYDSYGHSHAGFVEQHSIVKDSALQGMAYTLYMVPLSADGYSDYTIREKHAVLRFNFYTGSSHQGKLRRMPVVIEALDGPTVLHKREFVYTLGSETLSKDLAEAMEVSDTGSEGFLFRNYRPGMIHFDMDGVYPVADIDVFKNVLKDYARATENRRKEILDGYSLVSKNRTNLHIRTTFAHEKQDEEVPFVWLAKYGDHFVVPYDDEFVYVRGYRQPKESGTGLIWRPKDQN